MRKYGERWEDMVRDGGIDEEKIWGGDMGRYGKRW